MVNYLVQNSIRIIYMLQHSMFQCAPMSTVGLPVLQPAPMLLQLTRIGGKL